jgi:hypothetical protein
MEKRNWRITRNPETSKDDYEETMYHCKTDDIWLTLDIPVKQADKLVK